ncbi:putative spore protein YtfJ [Sporotomaculum syntrophicum]|uniref:Spore protein YtfJ n=1 Tax=Sporotomaculum syntrophicum TaxID=182264 RepID=A0A9D3B024_9FIRM|nr:GerW family sporulation protein [Sporotomaculum syntrophicum]KAF1086488.1 putative spore protein YtfJ [Sporotomaculum syntrophicum]
MPEQTHPIEGLMKTAMESIKEMVDVNTVVGDPVETPDGNVIIPISRVACGFGAGGGEFDYGGSDKDDNGESQMPGFGGGSGAGVSVKPVGFLVAGNGQVRLIPVDGNATLDRLIDLAPQVFTQIQGILDRRANQEQY